MHFMIKLLNIIFLTHDITQHPIIEAHLLILRAQVNQMYLESYGCL